MRAFLLYLLLASLLTFILYGADKHKARRGAYRISERALLGASLLGGALGALAAMQLFRHKTKHVYFYVINVLALLCHVLIAYFLWQI